MASTEEENGHSVEGGERLDHPLTIGIIAMQLRLIDRLISLLDCSPRCEAKKTGVQMPRGTVSYGFVRVS